MFKVLLIEDDLPLVRMYEVVLKKAGFEVVCALNGEEGLAKIKKDSPDVVLLDLVMPKKDGFALLKELGEDKGQARIPVLCLSVLHQQEDIDRAKHLGAVDFLIKTEVTPDDMVVKIRKVLPSSN